MCRHAGFAFSLLVLLSGCQGGRESQKPIYRTLESLAFAMIDATNRNDVNAYQECFTFAEIAPIPGDLAFEDERPWKQVEADRAWLSEALRMHGRLDTRESFKSLRVEMVNGRRATVRLTSRLPEGAIAIESLDAVLTDSGWRFVPVRNP